MIDLTTLQVKKLISAAACEIVSVQSWGGCFCFYLCFNGCRSFNMQASIIMVPALSYMILYVSSSIIPDSHDRRTHQKVIYHDF